MRIVALVLVVSAVVLPACSSDGGDGNTLGAPLVPRFSGGVCPTFSVGENTITSGGDTRRFILAVNGEPQGAPVIFAWHWLEGGPLALLLTTGLSNLSDVILVAPFASGDAPFAWNTTAPPQNNPDLVLFDDLLACIDQQFTVDRNRIWTLGMSAGALWSAYLLQYRSDFLAAAVLLSGGEPDPSLAPPYRTPDRALPVLLAWGGESDVFRVPGQSFVYNDGDPEVFSFARASEALTSRLRADGHFVVNCVGDYGHFLPPDPFAVVWPFLRDHPRNIQTEPWAGGLPDDASPLCVGT